MQQARQNQTCYWHRGLAEHAILIFLLVCTLFTGNAGKVRAAESSLNSLFYQATSYYENGDYGKAVEAYEGIISAGYGSGPLYYNLGNAYYRLGEKGKALANYQRAKAEMPRDPDLRSNLEHLQNELQLTEEGKTLTAGLSEFITVTELSVLVSIFFTLTVCAVLIWLLLPKLRQYLKIPLPIILICLILAVLSMGFSTRNYLTDSAVVVVKEATARFEPSASGGAFYTLKEGTNVIIADTREGWYLIKRTDGKKGWVKSSEVEPLKVKIKS